MQHLLQDGKCEPDVVMKMFIDIIRTKAVSRFSSTVGVLGADCRLELSTNICEVSHCYQQGEEEKVLIGLSPVPSSRRFVGSSTRY